MGPCDVLVGRAQAAASKEGGVSRESQVATVGDDVDTHIISVSGKLQGKRLGFGGVELWLGVITKQRSPV